jgi:hypothetical protein
MFTTGSTGHVARDVAVLRHEEVQRAGFVAVLVLRGQRVAVQLAVAVAVGEHAEAGVLDEVPELALVGGGGRGGHVRQCSCNARKGWRIGFPSTSCSISP